MFVNFLLCLNWGKPENKKGSEEGKQLQAAGLAITTRGTGSFHPSALSLTLPASISLTRAPPHSPRCC